MTSSLRDALRQSGALDQFKLPEKTREAKPAGTARRGPPNRRDARPASSGTSGVQGRPAQRPAPRPGRPARNDEEMDLAKAYALRAQSEQRERDLKDKAEREAAERRRVQREQVLALLDGATRNRDDAETARHFEYGGKIRRVYVDDEQLQQVNDGRLGVIQVRGRYHLVERALALSIRAVDAHAVALLVDPVDADLDDDPATTSAA